MRGVVYIESRGVIIEDRRTEVIYSGVGRRGIRGLDDVVLRRHVSNLLF